MTRAVSSVDRMLAKVCEHCPVCVPARKAQAGALDSFVKFAETRFCPFCRAYGRAHGRPAHAPPSD